MTFFSLLSIVWVLILLEFCVVMFIGFIKSKYEARFTDHAALFVFWMAQGPCAVLALVLGLKFYERCALFLS